jgi:hypothetical protein
LSYKGHFCCKSRSAVQFKHRLQKQLLQLDSRAVIFVG